MVAPTREVDGSRQACFLCGVTLRGLTSEYSALILGVRMVFCILLLLKGGLSLLGFCMVMLVDDRDSWFANRTVEHNAFAFNSSTESI